MQVSRQSLVFEQDMQFLSGGFLHFPGTLYKKKMEKKKKQLSLSMKHAFLSQKPQESKNQGCKHSLKGMISLAVR